MHNADASSCPQRAVLSKNVDAFVNIWTCVQGCTQRLWTLLGGVNISTDYDTEVIIGLIFTSHICTDLIDTKLCFTDS